MSEHKFLRISRNYSNSIFARLKRYKVLIAKNAIFLVHGCCRDERRTSCQKNDWGKNLICKTIRENVKIFVQKMLKFLFLPI